MEEVTLATLNGGAVMDMFDEELKKVLANIADENTPAEAVRSISIGIKIQPDETRQIASINVGVSSKVAPIKSTSGLLYFSEKNGQLAAYDANVRQQELTDTENGESIFKMARTALGE